MKKNYFKPEIETAPLSFGACLMASDDAYQHDPSLPMPKRRNPAF